MATERRALVYESLDQVMPDVERLLQGHTTVGAWNLAQICRHLAAAARRVVDLPASTPHDPSLLVSPEVKNEVFATGRLPVGLPGPPEIMPPADIELDLATEVENLRSAIAHFQASPGPVIPHRFFGYLSKPEWDQLQRIHFAHHLSFAIPTEA